MMTRLSSSRRGGSTNGVYEGLGAAATKGSRVRAVRKLDKPRHGPVRCVCTLAVEYELLAVFGVPYQRFVVEPCGEGAQNR